MRRAIELAEANVKAGGGPFGAVIVQHGGVIAEGVNRVTKQIDPTAHAEIEAIRSACKKLETFDLKGCEIYSSCEPCPMCLGAVLWARLDRVYFAATQEDAAAAGFDDANFYAELQSAKTERKTPLICSLREEGMRPFVAWREFFGKVPY